MKAFIPLVWFNLFAIYGDCSGLSTWVSYSDCHSSRFAVGVEGKPKSLGRRARESDIVNSSVSINQSRKSTESFLTSIEPIPCVIHERVKLVCRLGTINTYIDWLHASILIVAIHAFE